MHPLRKNGLATTTVLLTALSAALPAQIGLGSTSRSGYWPTNGNGQMGNEWLGGSVFAGAAFQAQRTRRDMMSTLTNNYALGALNFDATIRFLKQTMTLAAATLSVKSANYGTTPNDSVFRLYIKGVVERNQRYTTAGQHTVLSSYRTFDLFPVAPEADYGVWPFDVTLRGNVGVGVEANCTLSSLSDGYARMAALGRGWGYGWVTLDVLGVFGISSQATFANTRLTPSASADARSVISQGGPMVPTVGGQISLSIQPIALRIFLWVDLWIFGGYHEATLVNWAAAAVNVFNILF